jgi:hypothetical protein
MSTARRKMRRAVHVRAHLTKSENDVCMRSVSGSCSVRQ